MSNVPTEDDFRSFYTQWQEAGKNKDRDFMRPMFPDDMPNPFFGELMGQFNMMANMLSSSGIEPSVRNDGVKWEMVFEGDLPDNMTMMTEDFFYIDGKWLKYDPAEE